MLVRPGPGLKYRDTVTKLIVPDDGFDADPMNLDIARALACGDLVEVTESEAPPVAKASAASSKDAAQ